MNWEADLVALLEADDDVAALVGARIYGGDVPQSAERPYIVFRQLSMEPDQCHDGRGDGDIHLVEIQGIANDYTTCRSLARAIDAALEMATTASVSVWLKMDDMSDQSEPTSEAGGMVIHRTIQTFTAHAQAVAP